jgi:hypothetical protein
MVDIGVQTCDVFEILKLPNEIIEIIFSHMNFGGASKVASCCKKFDIMIHRVLYQRCHDIEIFAPTYDGYSNILVNLYSSDAKNQLCPVQQEFSFTPTRFHRVYPEVTIKGISILF